MVRYLFLALLALAVPLSAAEPRVAAAFKSSASGFFVPGDAGGAVSPSFVMSLTNAHAIVHDRAGNIRSFKTIQSFFNAELDEAYAPRVVYDHRAQRWVAMAIYNAQAILFAVSQTADPTGAWNHFRTNVNGIDFSQLVVTRDFIVATTYFPNAGAARFFYLPRQALYAAKPGDPLPAQVQTYTIYDATPVASDESVGSSVYLVTVREEELTIFERTPDGNRVNRGSWQLPDNLSYFFPTAPQPVGPALDMGFPEPSSAVIRNGVLYLVQTVAVANRTAILFWKHRLGTAAAESQLIRGPNDTWAAYAAVAANKAGQAVIAFNIFSFNLYPSAAYAFYDGTTLHPPVTLKSGEGTHPNERWGNYNSAVTDPANDTDFWTLTLYSDADRQWATWWSHLQVAAPTARRRATRH